ncbi:MAG: hypothetical protein CBD58_00415 [bacterium TMED198]|nr:MAG: hypothetical protein CBD58_00415 [bacterium TMED198]
MAREKPVPRSQRKAINRGTIRSRNDDTVKNISVGLMDIDATIMFYFNNVIKPMVEENGETIKVPLMYSNPERWSMIQKNGYLVDNKKQLIIPLIAFKRTSIEKDTEMSVDKLDPKQPKLFYTFQKKYSEKNRYDKFSVQQGLNKTRELYTVGVPDYVNLTYDFVIWTSYTEQMNAIIEKIIWSEGAYWGEDGRFKFRTSIDNYTDASEVSVNSERLIRTNFTVTLRGYLLPEEFNNVVTTQKALTPKRILIGDDVSLNLQDLVPGDDGRDVRITVAQQGAGGGGLENPLTVSAGTGVSIGGAGTFDGSAAKEMTFSIGQDVATTSNVTFNQMQIGQNSFVISERDDGKAQVDKDWVVLGNVYARSYIVSSSVTHMTQSFSSGSTIFGDTLDDTHQITGSLIVTGSLSVKGSITQDGVSHDDKFSYLRKSFVKKSNSVTAATASFNAITASAPSGMTATSEDDFVFFINGQYMEHDALTIQQVSGIQFVLKVDADSIGYNLESDDEIIAMGKFNS